MRGERAANLLGTALLQDPGPRVRQLAAKRLRRLGGVSALVALHTAQGDTDESARRTVECASPFSVVDFVENRMQLSCFVDQCAMQFHKPV